MACLVARAWMEWYAEAHADMGPTALNAYLLVDRKCFCYVQYRRQRAQVRVTEADATGVRADDLSPTRAMVLVKVTEGVTSQAAAMATSKITVWPGHRR